MRAPNPWLGLHVTLMLGAALIHLTACGGGDGIGPPSGSLASVNLPDTTTRIGIEGVATLRAKDAAGIFISAQSLQWTSADPAIARVDEAGNVIGVAAGEVEISASSPQSEDACRVTVLPLISFNRGRPNAINTAGAVVGQINQHAFVWNRPSGIRELTGRPGDPGHNARSIADNGTVVGTSGGPDFDFTDVHPVVWTFDASGVPTIQELPWTEGPTGGANAISPRGDRIAGEVYTRPEANRYNPYAALWTRAADGSWSVELLPLPEGAFAGAFGLNDHEQVVGEVQVPLATDSRTYSSNVVIWTRGAGSSWQGETLATGGLGTVSAQAINASGEVVGYSGDRAVRWVKGGSEWTMTDLGTLGGTDFSFAADINDLGEIVGATFDGEGRQRAFIWTAGEGMRDLGSLTENAAAFGINNSGIVIGVSNLQNGPGIGTLWPGR